MGHPSDVERFSELLDVLASRGQRPTRIRVGSIEVSLAASPPLAQSDADPPEEAPTLSPKELEAAERELYESIQYGASGGMDPS